MKQKKFNEWVQLLPCNELSAIQLRVLMLILNYHNMDNWNSTSISLLAKACGVKNNTIIASTKALEKKGLITKIVSSYKKNIKATNDYIPNYEHIQNLINAYSNNCVSGISKIDNKDNINKIKENSNRIEVKDSPILANPSTNFFLDAQTNSTMTTKPNDVVNNPCCVNLNHIEELECIFNANSTMSNEPTNATQNPSKTMTTANDNSNTKATKAYPHINSNYIKELSCSCINENPTILLDLYVASQDPVIFIDAMNKTIEWLYAWRYIGMNLFIANIYYNADSIIKSKNNGLTEKQKKYASTVINKLREVMKSCSGYSYLSNINKYKCNQRQLEDAIKERGGEILLYSPTKRKCTPRMCENALNACSVYFEDE